MAKVEIFNAKLTGGLAEVERAATGADRSEKPVETTNFKAPPNAKAPPIIPGGSASDRSVRSDVVPIWRPHPPLPTSLMVVGICLAVVASALSCIRTARSIHP